MGQLIEEENYDVHNNKHNNMLDFVRKREILVNSTNSDIKGKQNIKIDGNILFKDISPLS